MGGHGLPGGPAHFAATSIFTAFLATPGAIAPTTPGRAPSPRHHSREGGRRRQSTTNCHWQSHRRPLSSSATTKQDRRGVLIAATTCFRRLGGSGRRVLPIHWGGLVRVARASPSAGRFRFVVDFQFRFVVDIGPASAPSSDSVALTFAAIEPARSTPATGWV